MSLGTVGFERIACARLLAHNNVSRQLQEIFDWLFLIPNLEFRIYFRGRSDEPFGDAVDSLGIEHQVVFFKKFFDTGFVNLHLRIAYSQGS